jgi:ferrous iron transport protein B
MLATPFISCSARLPIYLLFSQMFFGKYAMVAAYSMYLLGMLVAILTVLVLHLKGREKGEHLLLLELPEYKAPSSRTIGIYVWEKVKDYLTKAGTVIFLASVVMWFLLNFGMGGYVTDISESFGSMIGKGAVPLFKPIGLGYWQIIVALIAGISAKEVVVASCSVLFGISGINTAAGMISLSEYLGGQGFTMLNAYCMMVFCLLYVPCIAALGTIRREAGSTRFMLQAAGMQLLVAWIVTFLIYQIGCMIGG